MKVGCYFLVLAMLTATSSASDESALDDPGDSDHDVEGKRKKISKRKELSHSTHTTHTHTHTHRYSYTSEVHDFSPP